MTTVNTNRVQDLILEGLAVVLSILLAFAIDAWWDERRERVEEIAALESLYVEFVVNRDQAASVISTHEHAIQSVTTLMKLGEEEILALPDEAVAEMISFLANPHTFDAIRGSVDALTSSGKLGILRDRKLREALMTFVNILDDAVEDRNYLAQTSLTVWNEMARNGGPWRTSAGRVSAEDCAGTQPPRECYINALMAYLPTATSKDLLRIRNNTALIGYVNQNKKNAARYALEIREAEMQIQSILELLAHDLERVKSARPDD